MPAFSIYLCFLELQSLRERKAYLCIAVLPSRAAFSPAFGSSFVLSCSCWLKKMPEICSHISALLDDHLVQHRCSFDEPTPPSLCEISSVEELAPTQGRACVQPLVDHIQGFWPSRRVCRSASRSFEVLSKSASWYNTR